MKGTTKRLEQGHDRQPKINMALRTEQTKIFVADEVSLQLKSACSVPRKGAELSKRGQREILCIGDRKRGGDGRLIKA